MDISIERFDKNSMPSTDLLAQYVKFFSAHYPPMHDQADRLGALQERATPNAVAERIQGIEAVFLALAARRRITGLLEWKNEELKEGMYAVLSWIMVDTSLQGTGLSSRLHREFESAVRSLLERTTKPIVQLLSVHMRVKEHFGMVFCTVFLFGKIKTSIRFSFLQSIMKKAVPDAIL